MSRKRRPQHRHPKTTTALKLRRDEERIGMPALRDADGTIRTGPDGPEPDMWAWLRQLAGTLIARTIGYPPITQDEIREIAGIIADMADGLATNSPDAPWDTLPQQRERAETVRLLADALGAGPVRFRARVRQVASAPDWGGTPAEDEVGVEA